MRFVEKIKGICRENEGKRIGIFIDMDGVLADYDIDGYQDIHLNTPNIFLKKRPIMTTINVFKELATINNLELYIVSACLFKNQATDKSLWIDENLSFIKNGNRYFVVKEIVKYTRETKPAIKVNCIKDVMDKEGIDLGIYVDDEHLMLRQAQLDLGDKVMAFHISTLLD